MNISLLSIKRHVLTMTLSVLFLLAGLVAYGQLSLDRMPKVDFPVLTVSTSMPGADPETMARTVTEALETQLNTIGGLDSLASVSGQGISNITLTFVSGHDMKEALADVQAKIERARRALPEEAETPVVQKFDINASPVMSLMLTAENHSRMQISAVATQVQKRLENVDGVGEVRLSGTQGEMIQVRLDSAALSALGLSVTDVRAALAANHLQAPAGKARFEEKEYALRLAFEAADPETLGAIAVSTRQGVPVRLRDVAQISREPDTARQVARFNGVEGVALSITKTESANPVRVVDGVLDRIPEIQASLPEGYVLTVASEEAGPIRDLVQSLRDHLVEGTLLTALVIWAFLGNVRATLIVALAIPVSLLGSLAAFQLLGYTLNSFTLLALLLLIGIVVDDAIVVLENVYRVQETEGLRGEEAAAKGAREVLFPVAAATLTLVSVFAPIMYLSGVLGQVFLPFAAVVTVGVLISWFVAVTLTPMLCARFLRHEAHSGVVFRWLDAAFRYTEKAYRKVLEWSLRHGRWVVLGALSTLLPAFFLLGALDKGFMPSQQTGRISVRVELPAGLPVSLASARLLEVESVLARQPEVATVLVTYRESGRDGASSASAALTLKEGMESLQGEVLRRLNLQLGTIGGVRASASASEGGGGGGAPLQFNLIGPDPRAVREGAERLLDALRAHPVTAGLRNNLNLSSPQVTLSLDRDAAALRGVSGQEVGTVLSALSGELVARYYTAPDGERRPIKLSLEEGQNPRTLGEFLDARVKSNTGSVYPLSDVVVATVEGAASTITRVSRQYAVSFSGTPNGSMGEAVSRVSEALKSLPSGLYVEYAGQAREFSKIGKSLGLVLLASLLLLYLVMASQFNNYRQPGVLMLAQPLSVLGGLGALWVTGHSLNIYSMVGLMLLVGLTAKTGILLVDRANYWKNQGYNAQEAMLRAAPERLRPILMTALTVIASLFPAALGLGAGSENNAPLAVAVIGGMLSATSLTLLVIPVAYCALERATVPKCLAPRTP